MSRNCYQVGNRAWDVGLSIDRFEPLGETTKDFYSEILTMRLKGTYHEIATYIDSIGKMDRIVNVTGIRCRTLPLRINA